jgi:hypothetical protein
MRTVTTPQLRQRWPETEEACNSKEKSSLPATANPSPRLTSVSAQKPRRVRWNPGEHEKWF